MMRHFFLALCFFLAAAAVCPAARAGEHPWNNRRIYYVIEHLGQMTEKGYFVRRTGSYQREVCLVTDEIKHFYRPGNPAAPIRSVRTRTVTTLDGIAIERTEASLTAGDDSQETITIQDGEAVFAARGYYGQSGTVPVTPDAVFEISGEILAAVGQRAGNTYEANVLDRLTRGVITTEIVVLEQTQPAADGNPPVWLAEIATPGRPPVRARFTPDGRLLRLEGAGMAYQVVSRGDYDIGQIPSPGQTTPDGGQAPATGPVAPPPYQAAFAPRPGTAEVAISQGVPAWDSFGWLVLDAGPAADWAAAIPNSEYAEVQTNGAQTVITAFENAPAVNGGVSFPMEIPPDIRPLLSASDVIPSSHEAVIEAAYVAVLDSETNREETDVLRAVSYLAGWINQSISVEEWNGYDSSALDTLARRAGDSLGHARLFAAMARTLGVPTRLCQGLVALQGRAVNHCWVEAWINGTWIPVDTTVSRVGLPAGYVLAERDDGRGLFRLDFADFLRGQGLSLNLLKAGRETPLGGSAELTVDNRATYAVTEGNWMANLYWGFALRLPRQWTGNARLNSVEMASPGGLAKARCEALVGNFQAGQEELEATVESLRRGMDRFQVVESRIVSFDGSGAAAALYVDFSCFDGGQELRCRQYVLPRRNRAFRLSFWAPYNRFAEFTPTFDRLAASFEY